jgi:predicted nucleotidyltransferase component of viral defense system
MTSKKPINIATSIQAKLLNLSKKRGEDYNYLLTRYVGERLLYRLSQSLYQKQYILKGATLFKIWNGEPHRATKDLDLLCFGNNEIEYLVNVYQEICAIHCEEGVRIKLKGQLVKIVITIQVDIGFGDAVTPDAEEVEIEPILDTPKPRLRIYPRETVVAEKFQAMVSLGIRNSRIKDFYDIWFLCKNFEFQGDLLRQAFINTFQRRKTEIPLKEPLALTEEFANDSDRHKQWQAFKNKLKIVNAPNSFGDLINEIKDFIMPPCLAAAENETFDKLWTVSGKWQDANK